ncbi:MAG: BlaI/MecI/CopY family transcriptional regulator [Dokdonella sp.]
MSISEAESVVMDVLWKSHPATAEDVVVALAGRADWQDVTIRTMLNRLLKKGAITAQRDGRRYLYRPLVKRTDYMHAESKTLLDRLFEGRLVPMVAHFSAHQKLSKKEIAELKRLVEKLDHE